MNHSTLYWLGIAGLTALVVTSIGFRKTVWFISIGYTATIVVFVLLTATLFAERFHYFNWLQLLTLLLWGGRLGFYLIAREANPQYAKEIRSTIDRSQALKPLVKTGIWLAVSLLYVTMFSPALFAVL